MSRCFANKGSHGLTASNSRSPRFSRHSWFPGRYSKASLQQRSECHWHGHARDQCRHEPIVLDRFRFVRRVRVQVLREAQVELHRGFQDACKRIIKDKGQHLTFPFFESSCTALRNPGSASVASNFLGRPAATASKLDTARPPNDCLKFTWLPAVSHTNEVSYLYQVQKDAGYQQSHQDAPACTDSPPFPARLLLGRSECGPHLPAPVSRERDR